MKKPTNKPKRTVKAKAATAPDPAPATQRKRLGRPSTGREPFGIWCKPSLYNQFKLTGMQAGIRTPGEIIERIVASGKLAQLLQPS